MPSKSVIQSSIYPSTYAGLEINGNRYQNLPPENPLCHLFI